MKKRVILFLILASALFPGMSQAEDITGKFGVYGKIGFLVPADSEITVFYGANLQDISTDVGIVGGGGFLYGINRNLAAELEMSYASFTGTTFLNSFDFDTFNISLGLQYRFGDIVKNLVPYVGGGLDILINGASNGYDVDTVPGMHLSGGIDYFITRHLALNSELKFVIAPSADMSAPVVGKVGNFDPTSFSMTFGVRYFIN